MKMCLHTALALTAVFAFSMSTSAGVTPASLTNLEVKSQPPIVQTASSAADFARKSKDFERFAKLKVQQLNRNYKYSVEHMEIVRQPDGWYRARYHLIDDTTLTFKVRRSQSAEIPYVGVLSYREQVFESVAATPEKIDQNLFALVEVIPNRHIFSYRKGAWN